MTDMLEQHFSRLKNPADDSDWRAVRRRAARPRRRLALAAAVAVAAVFLVTPAFGIGDRVLDLIQGTPAPPAVQQLFAANNEVRRQLLEHRGEASAELGRRYPRAVPGEARGIAALETEDGPVYLWVAPTEDGRQCWLIQTGEEPATGRPTGFGSCDGQDPAGPIQPNGPIWTYVQPSISLLHVRVYDNEIARVDVELEGAASVSIPVVGGHALAVTPKEIHAPNVVVGLNADGDELARWLRPTLADD